MLLLLLLLYNDDMAYHLLVLRNRNLLIYVGGILGENEIGHLIFKQGVVTSRNYLTTGGAVEPVAH